jgi:hypothetical protein
MTNDQNPMNRFKDTAKGKGWDFVFRPLVVRHWSSVI